SSGSLQHPLRAAGHRVPDRQCLSQRGPPSVCESVVLPRHAALRLLPPALHEPSLLEPPERRVQRPLLEVEEPVRPVAQFVEDLEPVLLFLREEREEAELDRALLQFRRPLRGDFGHPARLVSGPRYIGFRSGIGGAGGRTVPTPSWIPPWNAVIRRSRFEAKKGKGEAVTSGASPSLAGTGRDPRQWRRPPAAPRGSSRA